MLIIKFQRHSNLLSYKIIVILEYEKEKENF